MHMKIWDKGIDTDARIEAFTVGEDRYWDRRLAPYDIEASKAHAQMLGETGLIGRKEARALVEGLDRVAGELESAGWEIRTEFEDVHSQIEHMLIETLGDTGKKIHTARSRNDQVLVAMQLYLRDALIRTKEQTIRLFDILLDLAVQYAHTGMPGYTHMQVAMPSSFGLWFSSYAEQLLDDLCLLGAAYRIADQNPLGSAAGYGSSFPIDRLSTTRKLGFGQTKYNSIAAQLSRGKVEGICVDALASVAGTLSRLCMDLCLYSGGNFGFVRLPDRFTTGSSIMPHKKNPDVFELIRAHCNQVQASSLQIRSLLTNLPSGYHRDLQLSKGIAIGGFETIWECLDLLGLCLPDMEVNPDVLEDTRYDYLYTVDGLNQRVLNGVPFRDAYREMAEEIASGSYTPEKDVKHTHLGSKDNLALDELREKLRLFSAW